MCKNFPKNQDIEKTGESQYRETETYYKNVL